MDTERIFLDKGTKFITNEAITKSATKRVPKGSILVVTRVGLGKVALSETEICTSQDFQSIVPSNDFDPLYLTYSIKKLMIKKSQINQGTSIKGITKNDLREFIIHLPDKDEQRKVSSFLEIIDTKISLLECKLENLKLFNKGLIDNLIKENLSQSYKLGELGSTVNGLNGKTKDDFGTGEPFVNYLNVYNNVFVDINQCEKVMIYDGEKQNKLNFGDIIFTTSSETADEVGMTSVFIEDDNKKVYLNSFCFILRLNSFDVINPYFAGYYFRSSIFRRKMYKLAQDISRYNLSKGNLLIEIINLPSIEEQKRLSEIFLANDKKAMYHNEKLETLKQFKRGLLQKMLI